MATGTETRIDTRAVRNHLVKCQGGCGEPLRVRISIEMYDVLEWAVEIDGVLWASGDARDEADGFALAQRELANAGIVL